MTRVVNIKSGEPYDIYIGRPSKWGNPFLMGIGPDFATREEVITKYKRWLTWQSGLYDAIFEELKGKILACYCKPEACHGDVLAAIADGDLVLMPR